MITKDLIESFKKELYLYQQEASHLNRILHPAIADNLWKLSRAVEMLIKEVENQ